MNIIYIIIVLTWLVLLYEAWSTPITPNDYINELDHKKRYISDKDLIDMYNANGTQAIEKLYTEDMVINTGDLGYHIQDILSIGILTNQDKWNKISKLLFDASLIEKVH
jgi:hypothetical protein